MIIGNGLIANKFKSNWVDSSNYIIFASGVSDSKSDNIVEYEREKQLILHTINSNPNSKLIYFSSILTGISNKPYYQHKANMENIIKENSKNYLIYRIPQIIGIGGNPNNLINFLVKSIRDGDVIKISLHSKRSLLDIEDLVNIVNLSLNTSNDVIILSHIEKVDITSLVLNISSIIGVTESLIEPYKNDEFDNWELSNSSVIDDILKDLNIEKNGYTYKLLKKYIIE